jgi:hypothetical protein
MRGIVDKYERSWYWGMGFICLVIFSPFLSADEVDKLIEEAGAPASFVTRKDYA